MRARIVSNVILSGLGEKETLEFTEGMASLGTFLGEFLSMSSTGIRVINLLKIRKGIIGI